jgi:hypothetical protein
MKRNLPLSRLGTPLFAALVTTLAAGTAPVAPADLVFAESGGLVAVEAEHFVQQELTATRAWHVFHAGQRPAVPPDTDGTHVSGASGGAYLEVLPDSRWTHDEKLVHGVNFANEPGKLAVLSYRIHFATPGRYHFWARVFSTGTEDNGFHVGLNGTWPASGQRWQTTKKNAWQWDSRQRTPDVHAGVPGRLFLDVPAAGEHVVQIAMREDGIEIDKWLMTTDRNYTPEGPGPAPRVRSGRMPGAYPVPAGYAEAPAPTPRPPRAPGTKAGATKAAAAPAAPSAPDPGREVPRLELAAAQQAALRRPVARQPDGGGATRITGELRQWHAVTVELAGPFAAETDTAPNPFTDYRFTVTFAHESGAPVYSVPGYFAADGDAANTSATAGTVWRAHLSPDRPGRWNYRVSFVRGPQAATAGGGAALAPFDGKTGSFTVQPTDKTGRDFRGQGRLVKRGHYLHHAGTGRVFLKAGPDAPETLLAYADFDDTLALKANVPLKSWAPHVRDWRAGDPTWRGGRGQGLIGALNYLAAKGLNAFSFLTYNAAGDGDNVWPFVARDAKLHYDCSRLDQWGIVFAHAQKLGLFLHFKLQENESDDHRAGAQLTPRVIPEALDAGATGPERKLYLRELIARFGHHLALNWNLGEENTQTTAEQAAMAQYIADTDPYGHLIVVHTFPGQQDKVYNALLETPTAITGLSAQNPWSAAHARTVKWRAESARVGRPWVVNQDEQNPATLGVPPDPGYRGFAGRTPPGREGAAGYDLHDIRQATLWGTLLAGGGGVEYYFGYQLPENDLLCEDFRSRDQSWDYCRIALEFFAREQIPVERMENADQLVGNPQHTNSRYCFAEPGRIYLVYLPRGGRADLDLGATRGEFNLAWYNPRAGGALLPAGKVPGGGTRTLTAPSTDDWLALVRR